MSGETDVAQARRWLEEQLVGLAGLRNAQPRDPGFRNWRQNTLTVLQRIWPNDPRHSERFRRIPFSVPGNRPNAKAMREWYSRGCTDAAKVLRALLEEVDTVGVPGMGSAPAARGLEPGEAEDDFPTVELPATDAAPSARREEADDDNMIDLGASTTLRGAPTASALDRQPDEPLPPSLKVSVPARHAAPKAPVVAPPAASGQAADDVPAAEQPKPQAAAPKRRSATRGPRRERPRAGSRERLKDMLGLARFEADEAPAAAPAPGSAAPLPDSPPDAPGSGSVDASPPRRRAETRVDPASMISAEFREAPAVQPRRASARPADEAAASPAEALAPPPPAALAGSGPERAEVTDASEDDHEGLDPEAFARATEAFLRSSPVLGSTGRPVQRVSDGTSFLDPDAVAVATLATEVGRLAVPESQRASLRAHLLDLARQLESGAIEWEALRESVTTAMEHPEVARRLMPVLLPWLDRAA